MKKGVLFLALLSFASIGTANAMLIDFDALTPGQYSGAELSALCDGVTFETTLGNDFAVSSNGSDNSLNLIRNNQESENKIIVTFDQLANYVSIDFDTNAKNMVNFHMDAYNSNHELIKGVQNEYQVPDNAPGYPMMNYTLRYGYFSPFVNIASIELWYYDGDQTYNAPLDGTWDSLYFHTNPFRFFMQAEPIQEHPTPNPEPSTILLLLTGFAGFFAQRRRSKKNQ